MMKPLGSWSTQTRLSFWIGHDLAHPGMVYTCVNSPYSEIYIKKMGNLSEEGISATQITHLITAICTVQHPTLMFITNL